MRALSPPAPAQLVAARVSEPEKGLLTEVAWNFVADDASGAVDLAHDVAQLRARQHELLWFLADEVPGYAAGRRQAHKQVDVVVEEDLSGRRRQHVN